MLNSYKLKDTFDWKVLIESPNCTVLSDITIDNTVTMWTGNDFICIIYILFRGSGSPCNTFLFLHNLKPKKHENGKW